MSAARRGVGLFSLSFRGATAATGGFASPAAVSMPLVSSRAMAFSLRLHSRLEAHGISSPLYLKTSHSSQSSAKTNDSTTVGTSLPTLEIDAFKRSAALKRPTSPHLFIYQPQLTWGLSFFHRVSGGILGVALYGGAIWYVLSPFTSAAVATYVAGFPWIVKFVAKLGLTLPLAYHTFNGLRHLFWDTATKYGLSLTGVYQTGYAVIAVSAAVGVWFAL
ncbi:cytochrome b subunit of succinate dehydrogenase, Sdh3p [Entophlyctis luteolus]|nr:cytochrome b subunit of succinate dehydrogenase, Sdh3p [Entophlyctis luteolus]KAJ3343793.1 cytochrome b subunit of succinate dehydrogenase, Sdh3p [Entophlyctis luteolus]KAJ3381362.1 cytochrome b subunit of succinate dehydrogenase, Sdh3p [Entophlyctis sp. JEL0112]